MSTLRIAVQMPSYNDSAFIEAAVDSVMAQQCEPFHFILSDDASADDTVVRARARLESYTGPHTWEVIPLAANLGPGHHGEARYGHQSASPILVHATADDLHAPGRVARLVEVLDRTGADLVCSNAAWIDEQGAFLRPHVQGRRSGMVSIDDITAAAWCRATLGATFAFRRTLWTQTGGFEGTLIPNAMDLILPLRAALRAGCYFVDEPLVFWRQHKRQLKRSVTAEGVGKSVFGEAHRVLMLGVRIQHIRELAADPRPKVRGRVAALQSALFTETAAWVAHRRRNIERGYRAAWVPLHGMLEGARDGGNHPDAVAIVQAENAVAEAIDALLTTQVPAARRRVLQQVWNRLVRCCTLRVALYRAHYRPIWRAPAPGGSPEEA